MRTYKKRHDVDMKMYFKPETMKEIAMAYRKALDDHQVYFEQNPIKQLEYTINCVFDSWDSDRAKVYRKHMNIANDWGTAEKVLFFSLSL
jgi:pyruvate,orthophosphate dikinase